MSDLLLYRQTKATEITNIYNLNIFNEYANTNKNILNIIDGSNTLLQKQQQITTNIKQLYSNTNSYKNLYLTDISSVNILEPIIITDTSNSLAKKALLIGINYIGTPFELKGCWNDVENVSTRLSQKGFNSIEIITDASTSSMMPTRINILTQLTNFLSNSNEGDILFFMYSGHGSYTFDKSLDELDKQDELIVPSDLTLITDDIFRNIILTYLKKNVTLIAIFDSCYSGTVLDLKYTYLDGSGNTTTINSNVKETPGNVILISGSTDKQTSADAVINGRPNGALTWSLLECLKTNSNQSWKQLVLNMRTLLLSSTYTQTPQLSSGTFINTNNLAII
jgi:hypothetical protein